MKKIGIVILNWNGKEDTLACLKSMREFPISNFQFPIFVVDNGSTDGSATALRNFQFPISNFQFHLIENKKNLGFSEGNNVGIKAALKVGSDFVMLLNNDTVLEKNLIVQLITTAEGGVPLRGKTAIKPEEIGIISPKIYFAKGFEFHKDRYKKTEQGKVIWYVGGMVSWNNVLASHRGVDEVDNGQYDKVVETDFATGACMFIKREVFQKIGFLDKNYFLYWEDADFCQRAKRAGFKILYAPSAYLWHKVAQSSAIGSELNDYYITRNRLLFGSRFAPLRSRFALLRESVRLLFNGRPWQRRGVLDYYFGNFGKGSFNP